MTIKINADIFQVIMNRRSVRKYKDTPVEDEKIQKCLDAARWAPSASNRQPWHFIIIKNEETRKILANLHPYGRFMKESPVVIVVLGDPRRHPTYYLMDSCIATQNFLLTAHAQGLGTCWMGMAGVDFEKDMKRVLNIPDHMSILCCVSLGYPAESPSSSRRPLSDMVSHEKFGQ